MPGRVGEVELAATSESFGRIKMYVLYKNLCMGSRDMTRSDAGMTTSRFIDIKAPRIRHQASSLSRALTILSLRVMFVVISLQAMSTSKADVTVEGLMLCCLRNFLNNHGISHRLNRP